MKKFLAAIFILAFSSNAFAQDAEKMEQVKAFVQDVGGSVVSIAGEKNTSDAKKREKIIAKVDESIDPDWIARFVLGKNYKTATDAQRQRFTTLYRSFMINTYGPKFKNYNGRSFEVVDVVEQSGFFVAKSEFMPKTSNVPILVNFRVKERNGKLVILDFIAEGVSLIETQRSEFNSAISQKGMDKFLDDLEVRVKKLKAGDASAGFQAKKPAKN